ncbi:CHRD domain-containing protein [Emticicia sp. BO119]|uniref:CHRD domain-containing protein n=1 Tax=Emticicia sp. BO119 TaxID=2757768 RepID=UPI0015EFFC70|nr:CHRD domain-containing protein [Emticicia sp. BO119]MBA4851989.1 CHRD domain-containing protein [Emticicia sp. BO119]
MKKILMIASILSVMFVASCKKEEVNSNEVKFGASLWGAEEVPAVTTNATGTFDATYNKETRILTYTVTYTGITPTAWHIHKGAAGVAGPVVFNFGQTFTSPFNAATVALTTDQETDLMNGMYYVNIHSSKSPSGEIRGQLLKK